MLVEELIKQLEKLDPNAEVLLYNNDQDTYEPVDGARKDVTGDIIIF
ncbi:hypothetical protein [Marinilactibacillus sp. Marseille-P9653]|nr:hypothetical protein [Marinilactibacillus sp. Marseille-P9653]